MESKLQIISGHFHGRKLNLPPNARPTQNRARIALFNMLESGLFDFNREFAVWDAFAGSGAFGIECLSRYAGARLTFTDTDAQSIKTVRNNLKMLNVDAIASVIQADAMSSLRRFGMLADLVFVDPPYDAHNTGAAFVRKLGVVARPGTIVVWEQDSATPHTPDENWDVLRDKKYGRARFLILCRRGV